MNFKFDIHLQLQNFQVSESHPHFFINHKHQKFSLTTTEFQYIRYFKTQMNLSELIRSFYKKRPLPDFQSLQSLVQKLRDAELILNPEWQSRSSTVKDLPPDTNPIRISTYELQSLPFFSSLPLEVLDYFSTQSHIYSCPANTRLIKKSLKSRDLFILLKGNALITSGDSSENRALAHLTAPAIFGERGFLLGEERSADVITTSEAKVARIHPTPQIESWIQKKAAQQLIYRIWILQALAHSEIFKTLPSECWSQFAQLGTLTSLESNTEITREGELDTRIFILIQGEISVWQNNQRINTLTAGSMMGEVAFFSSDYRRTATLKTNTPVILQIIDPQDIQTLLSQQIVLGAHIQKAAQDHRDRDSNRKTRPKSSLKK